MANINIAVQGRDLQVVGGYEKPSAGDVNTCSVAFDVKGEQWASLPNKRVTFATRHAKKTVDYGDEMTIPPECLAEKGALYVTLTGYNAEAVEVMRTHRMTYAIEVAQAGDDEGSEPSEPTLDVVSRIDNLAKALESSEADRQQAFKDAQTERYTAFHTAEANRQDTFQATQETRSRAFAQSMGEWDSKVDTKAEQASQAASDARTAAGNATAAAGRADAAAEEIVRRADAGEFKGDKGDPGEPGPEGAPGKDGKDADTKAIDRRLDNLEAAAKGVLYREVTDTDEAYEKAIPVGAMPWAGLDSIEGRSVVWNQLMSVDGRTGSVVDTGILREYTGRFIKFNGTVTEGGTSIWYLNNTAYPMMFLKDHVYYMTHNVVSGSKTDGYARLRFMKAANQWSPIFTCTETTSANGTFRFEIQSGTALTDYTIEVFFFDLTQMFGAGNEPTDLADPRIEWIKRRAELRPEYNPGDIVSAEVERMESWGMNLLDPANVNAFFPTNSSTAFGTDGVLGVSSSAISVWFKCRKDTDYTISKSAATSRMRVWGTYNNEPGIDVVCRRIATNDSASSLSFNSGNHEYIGVQVVSTGENWPDWVQVEPGTTATEYIPYGMKGSIDLPELNLKSAGSARDRADFVAGETLRKVGVVDLGTLNWVWDSWNCFWAVSMVLKETARNSGNNAVIGAGYSAVKSFKANPSDKTFVALSINHAPGAIGIKDTSFEDSSKTTAQNVAAFKAAMAGVLLYYELAEPYTEPIELPERFIKVDGNGTLRFAQDGDSMPVPNAETFIISTKEALNA